MIYHNWTQLPEKPVINYRDLHLWLAWLDEETPARYWEILSKDEHARAMRLCKPQDSQRFIKARGILRSILGRYLKRDPGKLVFSYGVHGKPALKGYSPKELSFNLSHSRGLAAYVIASGLDVGVDIEEVHPLGNLDGMATNFLSTVEQDVLRTVPPAMKLISFFTLWTCKEAVLKADGAGLTYPAYGVKVSLRHSNSQLSSMTAVLPDDRCCRLRLLKPAEGYLGALAYFG